MFVLHQVVLQAVVCVLFYTVVLVSYMLVRFGLAFEAVYDIPV